MSGQKPPARDGADRDPGLSRTREVDRPDFDPGYDPSAPILCDRCGHEMIYTASCRIVCRTCGYQRDCSDL